MEICSRFTGMERKNGAFLLHTDNANVKVCFVTDEIVGSQPLNSTKIQKDFCSF